SSRVSDARQPSFCMGAEISYPGVPFGTIRFEISSSSVRAVIVTHAVMSVPALVMNIFAPSITQLPSRRTAVVALEPASDPAPGRRGAARPPAGGRGRNQPGGRFPGGRGGAPPPPLLLGAEQEDRHRPGGGMGGDGDRARRVDAGQLLDGDRVRERVAAAAAV